MNLLTPFGKIYAGVAGARNYLYDRGVLRSHSLGARTISIGNITAGGTGKTPLVALVAETLAARGEKVCILTRGYGRKNKRQRVLVSDRDSVLADATTGGDEPVELARKLIGKAVVIADGDRVSGAKWALSKFDITTFILDDGFQHRRAKRDLDIVCIDATDPFGGGRMLPAGMLREPLEYLRRADAIVITRADIAKDVDGLEERLGRYVNLDRIFRASNRMSRVVRLDDFEIEAPVHVDLSKVLYCFAFCGLANPRPFFELLRTAGLQLAGEKAFPDHHSYTPKDLRTIESAARDAGAGILFTTAKDAVKLVTLKFTIPCLVAEIETDVSEGFREMLFA